MTLSEIGITEKKAKQFNKRGIYDTLDFFSADQLPRKYLDCTKVTGLLDKTELSCVAAQVKNTKMVYGSTSYIKATCEVIPGGEKLSVFWFNQNYLYDKKIRFTYGKQVFIAGRAQYDEKFNSYSIANPEIFEEDSWENRIVKPIYKKTAGMSDDYFKEKLTLAWQVSNSDIKEIMPSSAAKDLLSMRSCMHMLHFPSNMEDVEKAKERIIFNDLVRLSLCEEVNERNIPLGSPFRIKNLNLYHAALRSLKFELTKDQKACVERLVDLAMNGRYIYELICGDVGSGKTITAQLAMCPFLSSGYQTAIMAPTKILAKQHYEDFKKFFEPLGIKVVFLDAGLKAKEKKEVLKAISEGTAQVIVGTQSLIGKSVKYNNLALVCVDEQHRFGIAQRQALTQKGKLGCGIISLSATPIPKTLAASLWNSLGVSYINTMPNGRLPVITGIAKSRERIYKFCNTQVEKGRQIFVVAPAIEDTDEGNKASVSKLYKEYSEALKNVRIACLTGKDSKEKAESTMNAFSNHEIDLLISTSVIEVGINIPNASGIIICGPENFGLAQLHQLRGRVGRSNIQSYCVLESEFTCEESPRLDAICHNNSGFELAKIDLKLRGPGSLLNGINQSGKNKYVLLAAEYPEIYKKAKTFAKKWFDTEEDFPLLSEITSEGYEL